MFSAEFLKRFPWIKVYYAQVQKQYWENRHPKADIVYNGRPLPFQKTNIEVPVQLFIQPSDFVIKNDIIKNDLMVKDIYSCNETILNIYKHTRTKPLNPYRYDYDDAQFGIPELWLFPFELRNAKKGDCDDWGNELASYYIAAGVPNWRVRCVAGTTWSNEGHLTVYVLADDLKTWVHTNSTNPIALINYAKDLMELPKSNDSNDKIGIEKVWFSYNNESAWHEFEGSKTEKFILIKKKYS
jgi:hypothetical protein